MKYIFLIMSLFSAGCMGVMTDMLVKVYLYGRCVVIEPSPTILIIELVLIPGCAVMFLIMAAYWLRQIKKGRAITPAHRKPLP